MTVKKMEDMAKLALSNPEYDRRLNDIMEALQTAYTKGFQEGAETVGNKALMAWELHGGNIEFIEALDGIIEIVKEMA